MGSFFAEAQQSGYRLDTPEQIRNWVETLCDEARIARAQVDLLDKDASGSARQQQRLDRKYLLKLGAAQGAIMAMHRIDKITDNMAEELYTLTMATLLPTIIKPGESK